MDRWIGGTNKQSVEKTHKFWELLSWIAQQTRQINLTVIRHVNIAPKENSHWPIYM